MRYVRSYPTELPVLRDLLPEIETPVQIIAGARDPAVPPVNAEFLHERLPNSKLDVIDAGHFTWEDGADEYAALVTSWWSNHERRSHDSGDLLETVIEAHGGWNAGTSSTASPRASIQGGALWGLKGHAGVLDDVVVTASLHEERASHRPFGAADRHSAFTPERVAIETDDGTVLEALDEPRASFAGHAFEPPWSALQLAYFVGTAMWTYLTQPFTFTMPGFETSELEPWDEAGQRGGGCGAWPSYLATHSSEQTL